MRATLATAALLLGVAAVPPALAQQPVVAAIQVHGNTLTSDEEIVRMSGLSVGVPFAAPVLEDAARRLEATKRFRRVQVLQRYASIDDPTQIAVVIVVDEGAVRVVRGRIARRGPLNWMFLPILNAEDGYGLTYGAQLAVTSNASSRSVVIPLSWGGDKRAGAEFQQQFSSRWAPRVRAGAFVERRTHPFFKSSADRRTIWGRGEWTVAPFVRTGVSIARERAELVGTVEETTPISVDATFDTRIDPLMPRNAVYARASITRLRSSLRRTDLEADGYIGLIRGMVLALRAEKIDFNRAAPAFYKPILGGAGSLRGFRAGTAIGDTTASTSAELRVPLTSPLKIARFGASAFIDAGTAYDDGARFRDQRMKRGVGGGVWLTAAAFRMSLMVAHGIHSGNRVHFGAGLTF